MQRILMGLMVGLVVAMPANAAGPPVHTPGLAREAHAILKTRCWRCHGQEGSVEGGLNYILDRARLVARRKVVPGQPDASPLFVRVHAGKMPPPGEERPSHQEVDLLRRWIAAGAPAPAEVPRRSLIGETLVQEWILADLDRSERRARRFARYFTLVPLYNAGASLDEIRTYSKALSKLLNNLSWHPRISIPKPIDPLGLVLRIDLRDYLLDANLWNRLLVEYPYGIVQDSALARAVLINTGTRMPYIRADWFVATASRAPLYYDLLQIPANLGELERQLRVDVEANIRQERVARAGFNGSGISRNNRLLERHDAMNGAYWRSYDFEAVPQNLLERSILAPDRRNLFAYPLGPGGAETQFQHAGGEVIFNLPNGLHAFVLVNARNERINKGPIDIVSDPRRPDRAVEAGLSCMHCHARGIIPKDDQLREHVARNKKAFSRADADLVAALHPQATRMRELMEEDSARFQRALEKTGNHAGAAEVVLAMTLRYEADVDLPALAAEVGVEPARLVSTLVGTENLARNLGALKVPGGTVARQVAVQSFGDLVRELRLGVPLEVGKSGETLPDATAEIDPLEVQSSQANAIAWSPDGKLAALASGDRSVRIHDIGSARDLRRCIGHTASVWCVTFSPDGSRLLTGGKDGTLRLWEVETGRELGKLDAHADLVSALAFSPDGKRAISAGYDHAVRLWDLDKLAEIADFQAPAGLPYPQVLSFAPDGKSLLVASEKTLILLDATTGTRLRQFQGHTGWINDAHFASEGKLLVSASDDGTARIWDVISGQARIFNSHSGSVRSVELHREGLLLTGGADATVRLWNVKTGKETRIFRKHKESVLALRFSPKATFTLSGSRDGEIYPWRIGTK